jgi:methionyl-tRNA synthetase
MALDLFLPKCLFAHGWWTVEGEKMSKSRGNVVDPHILIDEFGIDAFRYFLLREVPFGQDGDFSQENFIQRYNSELANDLGNLVSRALTMIEQFAGGVIPQASFTRAADVSDIIHSLRHSLEDVINRLEFHRALGEIWRLVDRINRYIEETAPWNLAKKAGEREKLETVLYTVAESLRWIAIYLSPFMPNTTKEIIHSLGLDPLTPDILSPQVRESTLGGVPLAGKHIRKGPVLFPRMGKKSSTVLQFSTMQPQSATSKKSYVSIEDFRKLDLRVGKILSAEQVPGSEKLLKLVVDIGTEQRQVVAGMAKKYPPETLIHKKVIVVANLKPTRLMGVESQGMILAAGDKEIAALATFLEDVKPGTIVR